MILITGTTGLVGSHLLRRLLAVDKATKIRALKRANSNMDLVSDLADVAAVEWVDADILDTEALYEAMEGVEVVYHCAALVSFVPSEASQMRRANEEGTANVVNMALERGVKKLLYVSSIAAIGRSSQTKHIKEATEWEDNPMNSNYAISKYLGEQQVWRGMAEGLDVLVVNPSVILGEGDYGRSSGRLFGRVYEGLRFYSKGRTGFVDVLDVVDIMAKLMERNIKNERFILNAENVTYRTFFEKVAAVLGKKAPTIEAQAWMAALAWRLEKIKAMFTKKTPLITKETARTAQATYFYENQKIKKALNYTFRPLDETIGRVGTDFLKKV